MDVREKYKRGFVEILILSVLMKNDMYGYQIANQIEEKSGGLIYITEPSLYTMLRKLLEQGYLKESASDLDNKPNRKYYKITTTGKRRAKYLWKELDKFTEGLNLIKQNLDL